MTEIVLSGIYVYPVKSLRGVRLQEASMPRGRIAEDRNWILVDEADRFMHQRDYPQMARVETEIASDGITVRCRSLPALALVLPEHSEQWQTGVSHVQLWRRRAPVTHVSAEADAWFTSALGVPCRLMAFAPEAAALDVPDYEVNSSLQDATPFHLTAEESLADLNRRLPAPIPMNRFRPNLVVRGAAAYAEDQWKRIVIRGNVFRWIKACMRCVTTMTDQETGERARREPLLTLGTYRRQGKEVVFGNYWVADTWAENLRVGDTVTVLD